MSYQAGKWVREKNRDGNWFEFILQKKGQSCGPACVLIMKQLKHPGQKYALSEDVLRGLVALGEGGQLNTGVSPLSHQAGGLHDWSSWGSDPGPLVHALRSQPAPIPMARTRGGVKAEVFKALQDSSSKQPCIVGWWWGKRGDTTQGGHWTVCVGPTKDGRDLTILDPWNGIQYIANHLQGFSTYICQTDTGQVTGWFDPNDAVPGNAAVITSM